jgi:tetratricopeptide (TPR) repeat protein
MELRVTISVLVAAFWSATATENSPGDSREKVAQIVSRLQRADYEGNQAMMQKSYDDLAPFIENNELKARVRYWRGFAKWRRAINGFNDAVDPNELEQGLETAIDEFKAASELDPKFVDAKVGLISSLGYLAFMNVKDQSRTKELVGQIMALFKEADAMAPDNPRLIWIHGPILWNTPPERGGGQDKAIENYERGLEICSKMKTRGDALEPIWGKPELMMSLAYSYANKSSPDLDAAERHARGALELVPHWHYVGDILLPQILAKKSKTNLRALRANNNDQPPNP